jgi:hypothetical protein
MKLSTVIAVYATGPIRGGTFRLDGRLTPESGAVVLAALEPYRERIFAQARKDGRRESYDAYAADALVEMGEHARRCRREPERSSPSAVIHVQVDHAALLRGHLADGETCEIPGIGAISVATAQALASDAIVSAVLTGPMCGQLRTWSHHSRPVTHRTGGARSNVRSSRMQRAPESEDLSCPSGKSWGADSS